MLSKNIFFKNFQNSKVTKKLKLSLKRLLLEKKGIIESLSNSYKDSYDIKKIKKKS